MKDNIKETASRLIAKASFKVKKHSPEILLVTGITAGIAGTVVACKATLKVDNIIKEHKENIEKINEGLTNEEYKDKYNENDAKKDLTKAYAITAGKLIRLYAPAIALEAISISCLVGSHRILHKRNIALMTAYTVLDNSYKKYRKNVIDKLGKDADDEFRLGIKTEEIETTDEKGKKKKEVVTKVDNNGPSVYAKFFDELSDYYRKDANYNLLFLKKQQNWANDRLRAQGYLFLNDVYESLGIPKTPDGQFVGWIYNPEDKTIDSYVDFGIYDGKDESKRRFVNGLEKAILLDFNVDGVMYDKI
jgi:hypothetical protein